MLPSRAEPRPEMARKPSLESAASVASSSAAQSSRSNSVTTNKPLLEANAVAPDIAGLIAAAGSAEAALQSLWKDRQSTLSHNSQLWRVVEKQRTMILGLNKDLERALKDKERYRKKVKELTARDSSKIKAVNRADSALDREGSESPAPAEHSESRRPTVDEFPQVPVSSSRSPLAVKTPVPTAIGNVREQNLSISEPNQSPVQDSASMVDSVGDHTSIDASPIASSPPIGSSQEQPESPALDLPIQGPKSSGKVKQAEDVVIQTPKAVTPSTQPTPVATPPPLNNQSQAPVVSVIEATPIPDSNSFPSPPSRLFRKPAPAPLDLSLSTPPSSVAVDPSIEQPVAASIEAIELDPPETIDRGRRKTREDDDKAREDIAIREEQARSVSKKSKSKSKSKSKTPIEPPLVAETVFPAPADYVSPILQSSPLNQSNSNSNNLLSPSSSDTSSQQRSSGSGPLLSPGLPVSPRPIDRPMNAPAPRLPKSNIGSPPISPHFGSQTLAIPSRPLQQSGYSISSPTAYQTPLFAKPPPNQQSPAPPFQASGPMQPPQSPAIDKSRPENSRREIEHPAPVIDQPQPPTSESVFRGFISDQFPGLLLPPNAIPLIDVRVFSSRLRPSRHSILIAKPNEDDPVFLLGIYARADGRQLWRLEKTIMALQALHEKIRSFCNFDGKLPDRSLYSGHAPVKIDARRAALNAYFDILLDTPLTEKAALAVCDFFSRDVIGAEPEDSPRNSHSPVDVTPSEGSRTKWRREGYLTKRGKNFGGWKARYFVLESSELRYYDSPGGPQIGIIKLVNAQIGKQSQQQSNQSPAGREDDADNQYRHAFLILEPKKKDSSSLVRHVLCAESDEERDAWVQALLQYVEPEEKAANEPTVKRPPTGQSTTSSRETAQSHANTQSVQPKTNAPVQESVDSLQALSYNDTIAAEAPIVGPSYKEYIKERGMPSPSLTQTGFGHSAHKASADKISISGPTNGAVIQDAGMWGNKTPAKEKKRSIFGFRGRSGSDFNGQQQPNIPALEQRNKPLNRPIFGAPLSEAVELSQPIGLDVPLPAVVYRCIEYLQVRGAVTEEGIFRLSGSNVVIKALRDRFNIEGDVRLLEGEFYDVHAVASLLKLYLRELPVSILTKQQHLDFLKVLGTYSCIPRI
jgi:RalA-binding protein 1